MNNDSHFPRPDADGERTTSEGAPPTAPGRVRGRIDWPSAVMALITSVALTWGLWLRFGPPRREAPVPGTVPPRLQLLDTDQAEPVFLTGLRGKVVWLVFWSADAPSAPTVLDALETAWNRFRRRPAFTMVAAAVETGRPERVRAAVAAAKASLPVYLASDATQRAYGVRRLPLQLLIDEDGRILAVAQGASGATMARLADRVEERLDTIEPPPGVRFGRGTPREPDQGLMGFITGPYRTARVEDRELGLLRGPVR